jgi:hypothetical protein
MGSGVLPSELSGAPMPRIASAIEEEARPCDGASRIEAMNGVALPRRRAAYRDVAFGSVKFRAMDAPQCTLGNASKKEQIHLKLLIIDLQRVMRVGARRRRSRQLRAVPEDRFPTIHGSLAGRESVQTRPIPDNQGSKPNSDRFPEERLKSRLDRHVYRVAVERERIEA